MSKEVHEEHPEFDDVYYVERFCACGAIRKIRAHKETLWNAEKTGIIDKFDAEHSDPPHKPVSEEAAKKQRELIKAAMGRR